MKIDTETNLITDNNKIIDLYSKEGFKLLSDLWLKVGWDQKYMYSFTWLGRPIIQIPEDIIRIQELIYDLKPGIVIETGVAHGGSLIFYATILEILGQGIVIGIDIDIRNHNRKEIESHKLSERIKLIEGNSTDTATLKKINDCVENHKNVLVILDSCHDYNHVISELEAYSQFVTKGSYIVVTDGIQEILNNTPRAKKDYKNTSERWSYDNPKKAIFDFVEKNTNFVVSEPKFIFNESNVDFRITNWPSAFLYKKDN